MDNDNLTDEKSELTIFLSDTLGERLHAINPDVVLYVQSFLKNVDKREYQEDDKVSIIGNFRTVGYVISGILDRYIKDKVELLKPPDHFWEI